MSNINTGKAIDFKLLKRVLHFTHPYRKVLFLSIFFSILLSFLSPIRPFLINYAVDNYIMEPDPSQLRFICIVLLSILLLESVVQFLYIYLATWLGQNVIQDLRASVYQHILKLKMKYFDNTPIGSLVTALFLILKLFGYILSRFICDNWRTFKINRSRVYDVLYRLEIGFGKFNLCSNIIDCYLMV